MQLADGRMESIEAALAAMLQERLLTVEQDTFTLKGENAALKSQVNQLHHKLERQLSTGARARMSGCHSCGAQGRRHLPGSTCS